MKYSAFSPGSVTLFFEIVENPDPLLTGSKGVGICLSEGVITEVEEGDELKIIVNGKETRGKLQEFIAKKYGFMGTIKNHVHLPISQGLGMSGAIALSTSLALAQWKGRTYLEAARVAHEAEITMRTGLGDVATQFEGGLTIRLKPGIQPYGVVDRFPFRDELRIIIFDRPLKTSHVLQDESCRKKIKRLGQKAMKEFLKTKNPKNAIKIAREFAFELNFMSDKLRGFLENCKNATQSMIGNSAIIIGNCEFDLEEFKIYKISIGDRAHAMGKNLRVGKDCRHK